MHTYLNASPDAAKAFYLDYHQAGEITMLNLLRFKTKADYRDFPSLRPKEVLSGAAAYQLYLAQTLPLLEQAGGRVLFYGRSKQFLIGPEAETWDAVLVVQYPSVERFLAFAQSEAYLKTAGHRTAALEDSRLLPSSEMK